ncbi:hypothetical protein HT576_15815 [Haloterrigena sp. SYSU A121-1]|uniref:Uncharacterized protein n=1 Tax=Haloterrigena gelatinilytica TaxID=2741724 RepID=A0A8J8GM14_9EURY|nr:hypothetical protein [Haloterrigena gelatinilytica]NUB92479.1 hypothetical protein [Haloterrigena gelatinilytica]
MDLRVREKNASDCAVQTETLTGDERFVETTRTLHERAPEPTRLEVLPGEEHGQRLFETDRGDDLESWIDDLIETACDG